MGTPNLDTAAWRKSSYSDTGGDCVELTQLAPGATAIRDSKNVTGPQVIVTARAWASFIAALKND
ncbi:DUF397 domain-containing protein [Streptomyces sp. NRRL F-4489]|uniref:DUF397 domain-containing protein n=1 Tax=Streptomyces sp. NRRL F-4489 TaxID=1609095 RepID=UPI00099E1D03|nr:DUF397 domain-containing protein [Streptomyces sp. NRRL F-4489]